MFIQSGYGTVTAIHVSKQGVFVDIIAMPTGEKLTGAVLFPYVGPGFGFYAPPAVDDTVVFVCPSGNPGAGLYVVGCFYERSEPLPDEAINAPDDILLKGKDGANLLFKAVKANVTLHCEGTGQKVVVEATDGDAIVSAGQRAIVAGKQAVLLGSANAAEPMVLGNLYKALELPAIQTLVAFFTAASATFTAFPPLAGLAASATAANVALTKWVASYETALSKRVKGEL